MLMGLPAARGATRAIARLGRGALRLLPAGLVVPVPFGPMRGMWWMPESAPNSAWLGRLERGQLEAFLARITTGMTVWDVGANVGLYTIPSGRAVTGAGAVYAFEPVPRNVEYLRRHIALNRLPQVHVVEVAVSDCPGLVRMTPGHSASEAAVSADGPWVVNATSLDRWRSDTHGTSPGLIKIDVEGNEHRVLAGSVETLCAARPIVFLSIHGAAQARACGAILAEAGYRIRSLQPGAAVDAASEWLAEPI